MISQALNFLLSSFFLGAMAFSSLPIAEPVNLSELSETRKPSAPTPELIANSESLGVEVSAPSFLVVEPNSGAILAEKNADSVRSIASITKLMTALVILDGNPDWDQEVTMTLSDFTEEATPMFSFNDQVKVKDLFYAMLVASSNEAANALVRSSGLSREEFIAKMNLIAKLLELDNANFVDPVGLSAGNQATAKEVTKLMSVAYSHSEVRKAASLKSLEVKVLNKNAIRRFVTTNRLLNQPFGDEGEYLVEMGKTGFIYSAGYCFTSQVKDKDGRLLLVTVLGTPAINDRFTDTKSLAYWVFNNYQW
jgi:serine-type D-Ala-D-Ala endopeptidase (penicillin-binding protein 7)